MTSIIKYCFVVLLSNLLYSQILDIDIVTNSSDSLEWFIVEDAFDDEDIIRSYMINKEDFKSWSEVMTRIQIQTFTNNSRKDKFYIARSQTTNKYYFFYMDSTKLVIRFRLEKCSQDSSVIKEFVPSKN